MLASPSVALTLDGGGHQVTISGNNTARAFCNNTNVSFTAINLTIAGGASLGVYDASGRIVRQLVHGALTAGPHAIEWDGRDATGHKAAAGIYFVRLRFDSHDRQTKLVKLQ